jgi:hypothetical protein
MNKSARSNILRAVRRTLLVNNLVATRIVDRLFVPELPMHDVVVSVEDFDRDSASGWCVLSVAGNHVGSVSLGAGDLARWLASDEGVARIEAKAAEDAAEEALKQRGTILGILHSDRWPGTAVVILDDRRAFPLIPLTHESAEDVRRQHVDLCPGTPVVMRIVPASEIIDDYARTLDQTQPCIDWIMRDREAA